MTDDRIHLEPDADGGLEDIWVAGQPIGNILNRLNERVRRLEKENEELAAENTDLRQRVAELEAKADPDPHSKDYDEMTRDERVRVVREALVSQAKKVRTGKAKFDYKDVLLIFQNRPSAAYAYKLMELAAAEDGFDYTDHGRNALRVNLEAVKDETLFHTANKTKSEGHA